MLMSCPVSSLVAGVKIGSAKLRTLLQPGRQRDAAHRARLLIFFPAGPVQIPAHDALDRHHLALAHQHAAAFQRRDIRAAGQQPGVDVGRDQVVRRVQLLEPELTDLRQHTSLVGDAGRQHPVECADAVGADQQQLVTQIIDVPDLAASHGQTRQRRLHHGLAHDVDSSPE